VSEARASYCYQVERKLDGPKGVEVRLVRRPERYGVRRHLTRDRGRDRDLGEVLFHRRFKPIFELDKIETYAARLEQVAHHANDGTFGCFVVTEPSGEEVMVTLYERWFDGDALHCEQLAQRSFDPEDERTLVHSATFRAELEVWAEGRNEEREAEYRRAGEDQDARTERAAERRAAAGELARILTDADRGG
jgi:hypothetical protein